MLSNYFGAVLLTVLNKASAIPFSLLYTFSSQWVMIVLDCWAGRVCVWGGLVDVNNRYMYLGQKVSLTYMPAVRMSGSGEAN